MTAKDNKRNTMTEGRQKQEMNLNACGSDLCAKHSVYTSVSVSLVLIIHLHL